jgi:pyruvate ferredoxin oxidoreductase alpha subunit
MGSMGETASVAVDELRKKGRSVGLVKLRLWRPFPLDELRAAIKGCKTLIVMDRAVSFGGIGGPMATEIKSLLFHDKARPRIVDFIMGLGGRDVTVSDFIAMVDRAAKKKDESYEFYGVRE